MAGASGNAGGGPPLRRSDTLRYVSGCSVHTGRETKRQAGRLPPSLSDAHRYDQGAALILPVPSRGSATTAPTPNHLPGTRLLPRWETVWPPEVIISLLLRTHRTGETLRKRGNITCQRSARQYRNEERGERGDSLRETGSSRRPRSPRQRPSALLSANGEREAAAADCEFSCPPWFGEAGESLRSTRLLTLGY
ncbi:hypothetical protein SKAU_G00146480 [Synaphobranchus kaupii]|uniref:Uncharacterized protein n=1 Tax=Synaphobranchus kaupii TaxID=118154 RepID=A0A9Q1FUA2_SYNKA|nr:hypothetical protein SKAU_G00146480 [Synaphobranchus kaupii]